MATSTLGQVTATSIDYNDLINVPIAGTATRGIAAFSNSNFTVNGGTVSLGTIYPRYTGVPTAGALVIWSGAGTVTSNASFGTADLVLTNGAQTVAGVKTFSSRITASAGIMSSNPTIADDGVAVIPSAPGLALIGINANSTIGGLIAFRASASSGGAYCTAISVGSNVNVTTGALTGTTGTDGKVTVSVDTSGNFYLENRLGAAYIFTVLFVPTS